MKVLFLSNLFPDASEPYRGLDNATLLHHLENKCEIRVISPRSTLPWKYFREKKCRRSDSHFSPVYPKTFYVPKFGSLTNHLLFQQAISEPMQRLHRKFPFETILCSWTFPDTAAVSRVAKKMKVPFVGIVQGSDAHVYLRMKLRRPIIVSALNKSSAAITRSAKLAELLTEAGVAKEKLHPIYNGVDLELFRSGDASSVRRQLGLSADLPILLFVGNLLPVKNPLLLMRAHAKVCRETPCQLVMIGGGPMDSEIRQLASQLKSATHVKLVGRKIADEVASYMQAADLLCLSSNNEGVPNVILEAFASGLRVISTNVGGISEVQPENFLGRLVPSGDVEALASGIKELLREKPDREKIRAHAEKFSWKKAADAYFQLLQQSLR